MDLNLRHQVQQRIAILIFMSNFQNKSEMLIASAELSHESNYYPAVGHSAYYSCFLLLKHIWIYSMRKTQTELESRCSINKVGTHEFLINEIGKYIKNNSNQEFREFNTKIVQLKKLRVTADYDDSMFDFSKSSNSLSLSKDILPILKKY